MVVFTWWVRIAGIVSLSACAYGFILSIIGIKNECPEEFERGLRTYNYGGVGIGFFLLYLEFDNGQAFPAFYEQLLNLCNGSWLLGVGFVVGVMLVVGIALGAIMAFQDYKAMNKNKDEDEEV